MNILYKMRKQLKGSDWPWRSAVVCMWCVEAWGCLMLCCVMVCRTRGSTRNSGCCKLHRSGKHGNWEQYLILKKLVHHWVRMVTVRSCCLCINIRTGTFILGTVGIIMGAIFLAPMSVFLDHHSFYVTQFVTSEREAGKFMDDDQVRPRHNDVSLNN